ARQRDRSRQARSRGCQVGGEESNEEDGGHSCSRTQGHNRQARGRDCQAGEESNEEGRSHSASKKQPGQHCTRQTEGSKAQGCCLREACVKGRNPKSRLKAVAG